MKRYIFGMLFLWTMNILSLFLIQCIPTFLRTFPLKDPEAVIFTLTQNVMGGWDFFLYLLRLNVDEAKIRIISILAMFAASSVVVVFFCRKANLSKRKWLCSIRTPFVVSLIYSFFIMLYLFVQIYSNIPLKNYAVTYGRFLKPSTSSTLYASEYVAPEKDLISFNKKKNLIIIMMESIESNFQDEKHGGNVKENLIPELTDLTEYNQSFLPGGSVVNGTSWTMAAIVSKTCAIPLFLPRGILAETYGIQKFLPGARCLTDILVENGYDVVFSQGSDIKFASMYHFLRNHSVSEIYGRIDYVKDEKIYEQDTSILIWGLMDDSLYSLARNHLDELTNRSSPWAFWMMTIDTHAPYGRIPYGCIDMPEVKEEERYPYAIRCASKEIGNFIEWAQNQPWYDNTVIVVMGDHVTAADAKAVGFPEKEFPHYWFNLLINSDKNVANYNRSFTSFDMFPTILEAIGANVKNGKLGLGRSLYHSEPTLIERLGIDSLNSMLYGDDLEYKRFW